MKWNDIQNFLKGSNNSIVIQLHEADKTLDGEDILSTITFNVKCITVNGYLRMLGTEYLDYFNNELKSIYPGRKLIIAHDVFGGIFCINNGDFSEEHEELWYFSPDTLEWEALGITYNEFVQWVAGESINLFYESFLWQDINWMLKKVDVMKGILIYPFLWANECEIESASKKIVPFLELVSVNEEYRKKFA